ncbi:5-formyltetrahydrofolate cyclo-ligase [Corynebacterium aquatimens]|uniref:5-formyltetrahydrofolate cyclo-ligase n=1 Tax=Corynebacterium aquatimens TaxID=1190508 RepID=A0A931DTH4_9CORY|nr:5-formyltetrahydrofolate cyclo-ligase [Corynebacterium aquatimens]MBG6121134.1 5-formyltetrahydrofolate cyclo-ligase [Corynebacterium aquatimens]WJY66311.1 5-formyltetrahydrofolate cyclo-ligase family protein [Corynebacterium aquatimens]
MTGTKDQFRQAATARRRALTGTPEKRELDAAIAAHAARTIAALGVEGPTVAAYSPLPSEPGGEALLKALGEVSARILLPLSLNDGTLRWAPLRPETRPDLSPDLRPGALGILEPTGPHFPSTVLSECDAIILPALGVDRRGNRLGKGAGYYDRALVESSISCPLIALLYDDEVHDALPHDAHDIPVTAVITPSQKFLELREPE